MRGKRRPGCQGVIAIRWKLTLLPDCGNGKHVWRRGRILHRATGVSCCGNAGYAHLCGLEDLLLNDRRGFSGTQAQIYDIRSLANAEVQCVQQAAISTTREELAYDYLSFWGETPHALTIFRIPGNNTCAVSSMSDGVFFPAFLALGYNVITGLYLSFDTAVRGGHARID